MKRILSILLVLALATSMFAACGKKEPATPAEEVTGVATVAPTDAAADAEATEPVDLAFEKYEPAITITYARNGSAEPKFPEGVDYENNIWIDGYLNDLGIDAKMAWITQSKEDYITKLNLDIASGETSDIINFLNNGQFQQLVETGVAQDLTEVYNKYASDLTKEVLNRDGGLALSQLTVDGKLMALPSYTSGLGNFEYLYMRDDWRVNLGKEVPTTMEEVIDLARAFTFDDPDQNGSDDTYGFSFSNQPYEGFMGLKGFFNSYGAYPESWIMQGGKLVYGTVQPAMKDALASLRTLYEDGVIDPDFVVKNSMAASADAVAGKSGINYGKGWVITWPLPDTYVQNPKSNWMPFSLRYAENAALKGTMASAPIPEGHMVSSTCKNPEALIKIYNYFTEKIYGETSDPLKYHINGEYNIFMWAIAYGGTGSVNAEQNTVVTKALETGDTSILETIEQETTYKELKEYLDGNVDSAHVTKAKMFYGPNSEFGIENYYMDNKEYVKDEFYGADTPEMLNRMSILKDSEKEMILKIIIGEEPLEYFDTFVQSWHELGGEKITQEVNEWYTSK